MKFKAADLHCDTAGLTRRGYRMAHRHEQHHIDIPRMKQSGMVLQVFANFVTPFFWRRKFKERTASMINSIKSEIAANADDLHLCLDAASLEKAESAACILGIEGGHHLDDSLESIDFFYQMGVRVMTLTWNNSNFLAVSNKHRNQKKKGLTATGKEAVKKMNKLGIAIDLSHGGEKTFWDTFEVSAFPPFVSHSCSFVLCPVSRNITDEQAKAVASAGSIIGVNFYQKFLRIDDWKKADLKDVARHVLHFCEVAGVETVALGADYDGMSWPPVGLEDVSKLPDLAEELMRNGMSEGEVRQVFYKNAKRYLGKVL